MTPEKTFYSGIVTVTSTRIIVPITMDDPEYSRTYAMANICLVSKEYAPADHKISFIVMLMGLATLVLGVFLDIMILMALGLIMAIVAVLIFLFSEKSTYRLSVGCGSEKTSIIAESDSEDYINDIEKAINDAIIYRG